MFSIVVPIYNKENYIEKTLLSVLNQTYQDFEIIIVNDGSTDSSIDIIKSFKDRRIFVYNQENQGVSAARNRGIIESKNKYIAFLDADDCWSPDYLNTISKLIINYPKASAFATGYKFKKNMKNVDVNLSYLKKSNGSGYIDDYFKEACLKEIVTASSVVIKQTVFNEIGNFIVGIKRGEDREMWCRIALNYTYAYDNSICVLYDKDIINSATKIIPNLEDTFSIISEEYLKQNLSKVNSIYFEKYLIKDFTLKAWYLIENNNTLEARKILRAYFLKANNKNTILFLYLRSYLPKYIAKFLKEFKHTLIK